MSIAPAPATSTQAAAVQSYSSSALANAQVVAAAKTVPVVRVFRSKTASMSYVFKGGKTAPFIDGKYSTDLEHEIAEFDAEIAMKHPLIHCNPEEVVEKVDPLEVLRAKFRAEFIAEQAKVAANKTTDRGTSEQTKLNVANSTTIGEGAAGSDSGATGTTAPSAVKVNLGGAGKVAAS